MTEAREVEQEAYAVVEERYPDPDVLVEEGYRLGPGEGVGIKYDRVDSGTGRMPPPIHRCSNCGGVVRDRKAAERGHCAQCPRPEVTVPGDWWDYGNCKVDDEADPAELATKYAMFFGVRGSNGGPARALCRGCTAGDAVRLGLGIRAIPPCPVLQECGEYAIKHHIQHGIWGGMTEKERRTARGKAAAERRPPEVVPVYVSQENAAELERAYG